MSMSALPVWSDQSDSETPSAGAGANPTSHDTSSRNGANPWLTLFPLGAAAITAAVLLRRPAVRKAVGDVAHDPEVREVCKDAGERAYRVIAASWRRHGGPAGLAETFLR